ncbi:MAG: GNAT family N-acetyltransferase [Proteobacteria bacterium]|nr:GNAT family N-acetyltransferase [Pseudomonadota bacterium]
MPAPAEEAALTALLSAADVEAIERATLAALPPLRLVADDGWLLAENAGAVSRVNSVLPLSAGADPLGKKIERACAFYAAAGLPPAFRVSPWSAPQALASALEAMGFAPNMRTSVMVASAEAVAERLTNATPAEQVAAPDEGWAALFLGPGVDPAEGSARLATLARGQGAVFARRREGEATVAVGAAGVRDGWAGLHGMRTASDHRRRGHASAVVAALVAGARRAGAERLFLQVEAVNAGAIALYERLGFVEAYDYSYWRPA